MAINVFGKNSKKFWGSDTMLVGGTNEELTLALGAIPTAVYTAKNKICYVGFPKKAVHVAQKLVSYEFTEQLNVWGVRYGEYVWLVDESADFAIETKAWNEYNTKSDTIVMLGSYTDDGRNVTEKVIPVAKTNFVVRRRYCLHHCKRVL